MVSGVCLPFFSENYNNNNNNNNNNKFAVAFPRGGSSSTVSRSKLEFRSVGFCGGRKTGVPGEKPSEQSREPTTNSTHI